MFELLPDLTTWLLVMAGALVAGFTTGFAGFGTGLVASGFWFYALPAHAVPPLVAFASVAAQIVGLWAVRSALDWRAALPMIAGGVLGVPVGVWLLSLAAPGVLRITVGLFLVVYAAVQLAGLVNRLSVKGKHRIYDTGVGIGGGILGGFAGLSGPLPLIWMQLKGGPSARQRAVYQPFNLTVLLLASITMAAGGQVTEGAATVALVTVPVTLLGAWIGARAYSAADEALFRRVVLGLLLVSGIVLTVQNAVM